MFLAKNALLVCIALCTLVPSQLVLSAPMEHFGDFSEISPGRAVYRENQMGQEESSEVSHFRGDQESGRAGNSIHDDPPTLKETLQSEYPSYRYHASLGIVARLEEILHRVGRDGVTDQTTGEFGLISSQFSSVNKAMKTQRINPDFHAEVEQVCFRLIGEIARLIHAASASL